MNMFDFSGGVRFGRAMAAASVMVFLAACGTSVNHRAPVEDRMSTAAKAPAPSAVPAAPAANATRPSATLVPEAVTAVPKPLPGAENAGKPGYYTVKPGDTLIRIGLDHGQSARDIARWSGVDNPNRIEVGQVLRVVPPAGTTVQTRPVAQSSVAAAPLPSATPAAGVASAPASSSSTASAAQAPASTSTTGSVAASAVSGSEDELAWAWPAAGVVIAGFDENRNKGLDIGGSAGEPVLAAADGRAVYVGAGLRGYGNLIILKHNNTYLTAYAHNQTLLIKEDQTVRKGQKIAEMGSSDADRVKLHFEIRRQGKPVDPARYLPPR